MSEASKAAALAHAATVHYGSGDGDATLATAELFHAFITGDSATAAAAAAAAAPAKAPAKTPAKAPAKTPAKAPAKAAPVEEDAEDETADESEGPTKEEVGEAIEGLLNANLRDKVIKLFAKYKAKSLSSVKPEDYAAIKVDAEDLLLNA